MEPIEIVAAHLLQARSVLHALPFGDDDREHLRDGLMGAAALVELAQGAALTIPEGERADMLVARLIQALGILRILPAACAEATAETVYNAASGADALLQQAQDMAHHLTHDAA